MPCLSESISDLVRRAEANEVVGFVGGEGSGLDPKDLFDFMAVTGLDFANEGLGCLGWAEGFETAGIYPD